MLTPKENALRMIYNENPEYIPASIECLRMVAMPVIEQIESPMSKAGYDPFGVYWNMNKIGTIPDNSHFLLEDVCDWEKVVKIPDISHIDFRAMAEMEANFMPVDRNQVLTQVFHLGGIWDRFVALMGHENALISLMEEPEVCMDLFEAVTDYRLMCAEKLIDAYSPDILIETCDCATARGLLMSPETWRTMIKPFEKRLADYVNSRGVIFQMHCCGKAQDIVQDFVDIGTRMWHSSQPENDLVEMERKYRGVMCFEGGWDSLGKPGTITATEEDIRQEVRRCIDTYGREGNYIMQAALLNENGNALITGVDDRIPALMDEYMKCRAL